LARGVKGKKGVKQGLCVIGGFAYEIADSIIWDLKFLWRRLDCGVSSYDTV
jgi:hypothetical protein